MKKKRLQPQIGLSILPVSAYGRQPKCQYCHGVIQRMEWHTLKRSRHSDNNKSWFNVGHYHFACFAPLTFQEQEQLMKIVNTSTDIDDKTKKDLTEEIERKMTE